MQSRVRILVPSGTRSSCRNSSKSRPSPERTTVNNDVASKSALERIRHSLRPSGFISYRELGDVFSVKLSPSNRWGGFKALRERWKAHLASSRIKPVLLVDEAQKSAVLD